MDLLYKREQTVAPFTIVPLQVGGGVMFKLWAKAELDKEERALIDRYGFENALLIADDWVPTLRRSLRAAILIGIVIWIVLYLFLSFSATTGITLLAVAGITAFYYNELREHIYVRDLVHGRTFRCFSIIDLLRKEEHLKLLAIYLRQVLESAKNWGGREAIEVPPLDKETAKQLVVKWS